MTNSIIRPGDKLEMKHLHQNNQKTYKSGVYDILDNGKIEITIPTDDGKMVVFQNGAEFQFYFYSKNGMFTCEAVVVERYRRGNFLLFLVQLTTKLKKFQRREYFRLSCLIDFSYYKITDEVAKLETTKALVDEISKAEYLGEQRLARTKDLSGGGMRFIVSEPLELHSKVLSIIRLTDNKMDRTFYLVTEVIGCDPVEELKERWIIRGKFIYKNIKERDLIISHVFEEDRRLRKKESGK